MLTEHFVASVGVPDKALSTVAGKEAAIFIHESQPLSTQRSIFKKSATPPNCLAVSATHIFAAQAQKAVVHVYSREKGNQEAIVPFTEKIACLALACEDSVLALGTVEGRVFLWEIGTGRQITTSQSHLQAITALAVDESNNILLSASADSTVHVWSLPSLLSFSSTGAQPLAPIRTFASHRAEVTALAVGHSASFCNFAVTTSKDRTCLIWDFHTNGVLRTYLLPALPLCVTLDAADRAAYVGYDDGSIQQLDLVVASTEKSRQTQGLRDPRDSKAPVQLPASTCWRPSDMSNGPLTSISVSFDSCTVLSGHESGNIIAWDATSGRVTSNVLQNPLPGPVTNLAFLPLTGFLNTDPTKLRIPTVIKPRFGAFDSAEGAVPESYSIHAEFVSNLQLKGSKMSQFQHALTAPSFPTALLDEGLSELAAWSRGPSIHAEALEDDGGDETADFLALDDGSERPKKRTAEEENVTLRAQIEALRRLQTASFEKIAKINAEKKALMERERRSLLKRSRNIARGANGRIEEDGVAENDDGDSSSQDD